MRKIKKGDQVIVLAGRDKGKRGTILSVMSSGKVVVEGVNIVRRHQRPMPAKGMSGGIIEKPMAIDVSNVGLFNPVTSRADKVGIRLLSDGRKVRYFKSTNDVVDF